MFCSCQLDFIFNGNEGRTSLASSHHWSRELQALGHTVRLMPPAYVKPYVKRHKNDATDAEAICEAVTRPNMRFVATKTPEQQSCLTLHRTRHLFIRQQTSVINAIRAHLAEFGIVAPVGRNGVVQLLGVAADANDKRRSLGALPSRMRDSGRDRLPPDVRFAGKACRNESPALDHGLPTSAN